MMNVFYLVAASIFDKFQVCRAAIIVNILCFYSRKDTVVTNNNNSDPRVLKSKANMHKT